jgi:[ribosomal protein S5]-alanine N-acetyltransferase
MQILSTPRLHLVPLTGAVVRRRLEVEEFDAVIELPDGARTVTFSPAWPGDVLASYPGLLEQIGDGAAEHRYVVVDRETAQAVGELGAKGPVSADGAVEIGYGVVEDARDRGLGTEAVGAVVDSLAALDEVVRVVAHTAPDNIASQRVLENNGFTRTGTTVEPGEGEVLVWEHPAG